MRILNLHHHHIKKVPIATIFAEIKVILSVQDNAACGFCTFLFYQRWVWGQDSNYLYHHSQDLSLFMSVQWHRICLSCGS